jgi:DNA polymerase-3 subunit delta'
LQHSENGEVSATNRAILFAGIRQPQQLDSLALADQLQRAAPVQVIHCMQQWCYDLQCMHLTGKVRYFPDQTDLLTKLSTQLSLSTLLRYQKELVTAKREALHPLNPKLLFETILLTYQQVFVVKG